MIAALLEALPPNVTALDFVEKSDATLSVTVDAVGDVSAFAEETVGRHLRVVQHGRVGWAGAGPAAAPGELLAAALASARSGPVLELLLPAPAPTPTVVTHTPTTAAADLPDLRQLARTVAQRLRRRHRRLEVWAERSVGRVRVANSRGVMVEYPVSLAGVGVSVRVESTPFASAYRSHLVGVDLPGLADLESLVTEAERWLAVPVLEDWPDPPPRRAWLFPRAVRTLLAPVLRRLVGEAWLDPRAQPLRLDPRLTLRDDPLVAGRPGSRPICDDGVPTRRLTLVDGGRIVQGLVDLQTAARLGVPATGHGVRRVFGAPRAGFSNLELLPGDAGPEALARATGDGLLVLDLAWGAAPNPAGGVFDAVAPWTFLLRGGEVVGRLDRAVLRGNAQTLLQELVAVGTDQRWDGAAALPSLVVDGVQLGGR